MHLTDGLRALARPDLELLLERRPEAAPLAGMPQASYQQLASLLARSDSIRRALDELDRFHRQVLELVCLSGTDLELEEAVAQGLTPEQFRSAGTELARWGLAFPGGDTLYTPAAVSKAVPNPGRVGLPLAVVLQGCTVDLLRVICSSLGVLPTSSRKIELARAIITRFEDPRLIRTLVSEAPPAAATVLNAIRATAGTAPAADIWRLLGLAPARRGAGTQLPQEDGGLGWLQRRALAFSMDWNIYVSVPAEVELALRGRVFPDWDAEPPELDLVRLDGSPQPAEIIGRLDALLELWCDEPPRLNQDGSLGVREVTRASRTLGLELSTTRLLFNLAARLDLVGSAGENLALGERLTQWQEQGLAQRWTALYEQWLRTAIAMVPRGLDLLTGLSELPEGQGATASSIGELLSWRHPADFPDDQAATALVAEIGQQLAALGIGSASPVGLNPLGRAALAAGGAPPIEQLNPWLPELVEDFTVQADHRIIVSGAPAPAMARELSRFAELASASSARIYRLTESSIRKALDSGGTTAEILAFLKAHARTGLPQNVTVLVEDVGRRHGRLLVGTASYYVRSDDEALLAEVASSAKLKSLRPRLLGANVLKIRGESKSEVLKALRQAGFMPVEDHGPEEGGGGRHQARAAATTRLLLPYVYPRLEPARLAPDAARTLAERLTSARPQLLVLNGGGGDDLLGGQMVSDQDGILRLMQLAAGSGLAVEMEYVNLGSGRRTRRVIEPDSASSEFVTGYCQLRRADRTFALRGVRWARRFSNSETGR